MANHDLGVSLVDASTGDTPGTFFESGPGPVAVSAYDTLRADLSMDGGGDLYAFDGRATVIPEPRALVLLGAALAGLASVRRRAR